MSLRPPPGRRLGGPHVGRAGRGVVVRRETLAHHPKGRHRALGRPLRRGGGHASQSQRVRGRVSGRGRRAWAGAAHVQSYHPARTDRRARHHPNRHVGGWADMTGRGGRAARSRRGQSARWSGHPGGCSRGGWSRARRMTRRRSHESGRDRRHRVGRVARNDRRRRHCHRRMSCACGDLALASGTRRPGRLFPCPPPYGATCERHVRARENAARVGLS